MIIRSKKDKDNPYVMIDKKIFEYNLSHKAVGILVYLLSKPDNWVTNSKHLQNYYRIGRTAVESSLRELEDKGFLVREQLRYDDGTFGPTEYILYENPEIPKNIP